MAVEKAVAKLTEGDEIGHILVFASVGVVGAVMDGQTGFAVADLAAHSGARFRHAGNGKPVGRFQECVVWNLA
jgi:hypothetical protein